MSRTVWFSLQALERKGYHTIGPRDFLIEGNEETYQREMIVKVINTIQKNYATINSKVDSMVLAQEYFKRSIIIVILYALVLVLFITANLISAIR